MLASSVGDHSCSDYNGHIMPEDDTLWYLDTGKIQGLMFTMAFEGIVMNSICENGEFLS